MFQILDPPHTDFRIFAYIYNELSWERQPYLNMKFICTSCNVYMKLEGDFAGFVCLCL